MRFQRAVADEQLYELERLWYRVGNEQSLFARQLVQLMARLGDKYQIDELAAKYTFTGRTPLTISEALEIKEELEAIDRLLKQLEEAAETAQIGIIDLQELAEFTEPDDLEQLRELGQQIEEYIRQMAEQQGLEKTAHGYQLTPHAMRLFQGKLLERDLQSPGGVPHGATPGAGRGRRRRRTAADSTLPVRRLAGQYGCRWVDGQRHGPRRRSTACSHATG